MKVLVTGGAGFIGSHLVDRLLQDYSIEDEIIVIDDLSGGDEKNVSQKAFFIKADCRDSNNIDAIFKEFKPEIVFHLAANAAENKAQFSPIDITSRNYDAFIKVITPAIKYGLKRFIFTSSIAVYGAQQTPFRETATPEPEDLYGISKLAIEQSIKVLAKVHDFEYVITRPHNVIGERQNMKDPYRNVVTIFMNAILRQKPIYIYGSGDPIRQFSYVGDVVQQLYECGFNDVAGRTFNLGSEIPYSISSLLENIFEVTGEQTNVIKLPLRPQEVMNAISDHSIANELLTVPKIGLKEGLQRTWEYCRENGPVEPEFTPLEIQSEKAPTNWL
jgi:UDP-glucose 4-epimerase